MTSPILLGRKTINQSINQSINLMLVEGTVNIQIILTHNAFNIELCILPLRTYLAPYLYIYLGFVAKGNDILYADRIIHLNTTCILLRKIFAKLYKGIYLIPLYFRSFLVHSHWRM